MQQKTHASCAITKFLKIFGDSWNIAIIRDISLKPTRFGELEKNLEISKSVLSARLNELLKEGFISKQKFDELPPRTEYSLTEKGLALLPLIDNMKRYANSYMTNDRQIID